jgi:nucleoside-diphosphate-sugar epimerase
MKKKILITGGAGFVGSHLSKRLLNKRGNRSDLPRQLLHG